MNIGSSKKVPIFKLKEDMKILDSCGLSFELNEKEFTAKVVGCLCTNPNLIIPRSIFDQSNEYIITSIDKGSFKEDENINIIQFPEDSNLRSISKGAFANSSLSELSIPTNLESLEPGWCKSTSNLVSISLSPLNRHFFLFDNKFLFGKSNQKSDNFDVLLFAVRNIEKAVIPSYIKYISPFCFSECYNLHSIEFSENSELLSIGKYSFNETEINKISIPESCESISKYAFAWCQRLNSVIFHQNSKIKIIEKGTFSHSNLNTISIPSSVTEIKEDAFFHCDSLESIKLPENSELYSIGLNAFLSTKINSIFLPEKLKELKNGWCNSTRFLVHISASPKNPHFSCYDHKLLLGKSDEKSDIFDVIYFAVRDIEQITVPPFITRINSFAFSECQRIKSIEFAEDSKLKLIDEYAFESSSIESISIPSKVEKIEEGTFSKCLNLKAIEFSEDSEIICIKNEVFAWSPLEKLYFPSKLKLLDRKWCKSTHKLNEFSISNLNRNFLNYHNDLILGKLNENDDDDFDVVVFARRNIVQPFIPSNVKQIGPCSFSECKMFQTVEIERDSKFEKIGEEAFALSSITSITIPSTVVEIDNSSFAHCFKLTSLKFEENSKIELIGEKAFFESSIQSIVIPEKVNKIGEFAFQYCPVIKCIEMLGDDVDIGNECFNGCLNIGLISLPNARRITVGQNILSKKLSKMSFFVKAGANIAHFEFTKTKRLI